MPEEYKAYTQKGVKKFASNEAFIKNKELKKEYENRIYNSTKVDMKNEQEEREVEEVIGVLRETTEVKITYG